MYHFATLGRKNEDRKRFKVCLQWKVNLAYPASFQALHANNEKQINIQIEHNKINNPNWQEATSWPSTSVAEHLNLGQPRVNSASGPRET